MLSADEIAEMAKGKLKRKMNQLVKALDGNITDHNRGGMGCIENQRHCFKRYVHNIARRRGKNRALVAVGHRILIEIYEY
ncbi:MAG: hypothetical protein N2V78_10295 [Methanophagales archaeon]|nr:hypothetical protein [Methanophagales archaeon]